MPPGNPSTSKARSDRPSPGAAASLALLLPLFLSLLLTSCSMFKLGKDLDVLYDGLAIISGEIGVEDPAQGQVIVLLTQPENEMLAAGGASAEPAGFRLVDYRLADGKQRFNFQVPWGDYRLMAFVDQNADFIYQPGEPAAIRNIRATENRLDTPRARWRFNRLEIRDREPLPIEADLTPEGLKDLERTATTMGVPIDFRSSHFEPEAVSLGMWEPARWVVEVGYGFYLLEPWDEAESKPLLLFVHGINGSPRDFEGLVDRLETDEFRVAFFYYPSGLRLEDNAYILSQTMNELSIRSPGQRITLVGHSMGGLIAKRYIQMQAKSRQAGVLERFVSISTPWLGHGGAGAGVEYAPVVAPAWDDLAPGSAFLERLAAFELPAEIDYTLIFSHGGNSVLMPDGNDGVVSMDSQLDPAMQDRANEFVGVSQDHVGILASPRTAATIRAALDR